jgi:O-antigen ligase
VSVVGHIGVRQPVRQTAAATLDKERVAVVASALAVGLLPLSFAIGPANLAPVDCLLAAAIVASLLWANAARHRWRLPYAIPVALLLAGGAFGGLVGPVPWLGVTALVQDIILFVWCVVVANIGRTAANLRTLMSAWAYSSIGWALVVIVGLVIGSTALTGQTATEGSRIALTFADPNVAANYFFVSIMLVWATGLPARRWLRIAAYCPLIVCLVLTGSNSGIIGLFIGAAVAGVLGTYRRKGLIPATVLTSVLVLAGGVAAATVTPVSVQNAARGSSYAFIRDGIGRSAQTGDDHAVIVKEGLHLYLTGPLSGEGPLSTKTRLRAENAPRVKEAHSDYVAALVERGVIGFLGLLILIGSIGFRVFSLSTGGLTAAFDAVVRRPNALVGAVVGTLSAGMVLELLHVRHVWTLFGLIAAVSIWGRR